MTSTLRRAAPWLAALALMCASVTSAHAGENYALLVAVQDYPKTQFNPLQYTRNDMIDFRGVLQSSGFRDDHIVLMHDKQTRPDLLPEIQKIRKQLDALLAVAGPDDTLIVAFSGHGVDMAKHSYFCPLDSELADPSTLLDLDDLYARLKDCKAQRKLLLADCCRNDPVSKLNKSVRPEVDVPTLNRPQTRDVPEGMIALFSCSTGETSREDPDLLHGVFFYHVIKGWRGDAVDKDGKLTLDGVLAYAVRETKTYVRVHYDGEVQRPERIDRFSGEWVLNDHALGNSGHGAAEVLLKSGNAHRAKGEFEKAIADFDEAVRLDPSYAEVYFNRGLAHFATQDYDRALDDDTEAIRLNPGYGSAFFNRGAVYSARKEYDKAIADYTEAVRLEPGNAWAFYSRGSVCEAKGDYDKAIADYNEAIRLNIRYPYVFLHRGYAYHVKGDYDKAIADYTEAVRLDPTFALAYNNRGLAYKAQGENDKANADLQKAAELKAMGK